MGGLLMSKEWMISNIVVFTTALLQHEKLHILERYLIKESDGFGLYLIFGFSTLGILFGTGYLLSRTYCYLTRSIP